MKNQVRFIGIVLVLLIVGYGVYQLGLRQGHKNAATVSPASEQPSTQKKPLYWHDPMVPGQRFDKPGKSPFMDMDLVPVYADDEESSGNNVSINPQVQQNLGIRTAEVIQGQLDTPITAVGNVAYNERDVVMIQARSAGFVEHLYVRAPLDRVKKGQALVDLTVPDWIAAQEDYFTASQLKDNAILAAAKQRMQLVGMNNDQIAQVIALQKVQPRSAITSPINGVVTELSVREGMTVNIGTPLFRINGLNTVWVNAEIPENLATLIRVDQSVEASTPALPGTIFKGRVNAILPEIDATTRTMKVRIELANPKGELVPGMFATVHFKPAQQQTVLLIPSEAVIQTGQRNVVMVREAKGKFKPIDVEIGHESNGQTEIKKGLHAGQQVVVSGQFLIDSEASLKGEALRMGETTP